MSCHHLSQESARSDKKARFYRTWLDMDNHSLGFIQPNLIKQSFSRFIESNLSRRPLNRTWLDNHSLDSFLHRIEGDSDGNPDKHQVDLIRARLYLEKVAKYLVYKRNQGKILDEQIVLSDFLWNSFFAVQLLHGSWRQEVMHWCAQVVAAFKILRSTRWDLD